MQKYALCTYINNLACLFTCIMQICLNNENLSYDNNLNYQCK